MIKLASNRGLPLYRGYETLTDDSDAIVKIRAIYDAFSNNSMYLDLSDKGAGIREYTINDLFTEKDMRKYMRNVVDEIMIEAQIPELNVLPGAFKRIDVKPGTQMLRIHAIGEIEIGEVTEGSEYKPAWMGGGTTQEIRIVTKKYGTKIMLTQEALDIANFDIVGLWARAASRAFARLKEQQAVTLITEMGYTLKDNAAPGASELGSMSGRALTGDQNGSMTYDDLMDMYVWMTNAGFSPDTILMNPRAWKMFLHDPTTRELMENGSHWNPILGSSAPGWETLFSGMGLRTTATGTGDPSTTTTGRIGISPWVSTLSPIGSTLYTQPQGIFGRMKIIITPFVPFTEGTGEWTDTSVSPHVTIDNVDQTDVVILDSNRCGVFMDVESMYTEDWEDIEREISYFKIRSKWGMEIIEQGKGIGVAKSANILRNYAFENTHNVTLSELDPTMDFV